ncbi:hypothetical protein ACIP2X_04755 [Streptomyces sp. NPDC089424]|uniref:hypothetical protein n=1 Tax=Streptomyces sp. NPDC089424 TaxID=3365917 RepID=UPI0037F16B9D
MDAVVNAVNAPPHATPDAAAALLRELADARCAELSAQDGLMTERGTGRLTVAGHARSDLLALGDLAAVNLFITSSISGLVAQTPGIVDALLAPS